MDTEQLKKKYKHIEPISDMPGVTLDDCNQLADVYNMLRCNLPLTNKERDFILNAIHFAIV